MSEKYRRDEVISKLIVIRLARILCRLLASTTKPDISNLCALLRETKGPSMRTKVGKVLVI